MQVIFTVYTENTWRSSMSADWLGIWESVRTRLWLCVSCPLLAQAVVLSDQCDPMPLPLGCCKGNVLKINPNVFSFLILLLFLRTMPLFSLMYISNTLNPFLLCWGLLKWFLLYNILYLLCIFTFSETTPLFVFLLFFYPVHHYLEPLTSCSYWNYLIS